MIKYCKTKLLQSHILSQLNPIHSLTPYFSKMHFNVKFPHTPKSLNLFPVSGFIKTTKCNFYF